MRCGPIRTSTRRSTLSTTPVSWRTRAAAGISTTAMHAMSIAASRWGPAAPRIHQSTVAAATAPAIVATAACVPCRPATPSSNISSAAATWCRSPCSNAPGHRRSGTTPAPHDLARKTLATARAAQSGRPFRGHRRDPVCVAWRVAAGCRECAASGATPADRHHHRAHSPAADGLPAALGCATDRGAGARPRRPRRRGRDALP